MELRPEIALSWRRAELSGLRPDAAVYRLVDIPRSAPYSLSGKGKPVAGPLTTWPATGVVDAVTGAVLRWLAVPPATPR